MTWIHSLWVSSSLWEWIEYGSEILVLLGATFEVLTDFEYILQGEAKKVERHRLAKIAAITLVVGLAVELGALARTNSLFSGEITASNLAAKEASDRATEASNDAKEARERAGKATKEAGDATELASQNDKEAARLNKLAEDERSARVTLQRQLAWREPTDAQLDKIRDRLLAFPGQQFDLVTYASEPECLNLENRVYSVAIVARWTLDPERKFSTLFTLLSGLQVNVSEVSSQRTKDAARTFAESFSDEGISAILRVVSASDNPPRPDLIVIDIGKNPASMKPVAIPQE